MAIVFCPTALFLTTAFGVKRSSFLNHLASLAFALDRKRQFCAAIAESSAKKDRCVTVCMTDYVTNGLSDKKLIVDGKRW